MSAGEVIQAFAPELCLLLGALVILALDMAWRRVGEDKEATILGLAVAFVILSLFLLLGFGKVSALPLLGMLASDQFAFFFKGLALIGTGLVLLSSYRYLEGHTPYRGEFYAFLLLVTLAIMLVVGAVNLLMLYLAFEFLSLTSYILVGYLREEGKSSEAAIKYFLYGVTASALMLYGISLLYGVTGTLDLMKIGPALVSSGATSWLAFPAIVLLLAGFGFKIALVPFH